MINTNEKQIDEILDRGVIVDFLPTKKEFKERLMKGEKMRFYIGADPTAKALHIGHSQNLILLEEFRKLGHEVIFLIGDFTAMIGDPTEKGSARSKLTREEIKENFKDWLSQTKNILSFDAKENPVQVKYNSEWLSKLDFTELIGLASNFTVQQMLERDMFEKRMKEGKPIHLHEFMYPLMQGYDSVIMDVDVELCGTDQIFNALTGRTLLRKLKNKEKFVIAANLIADEKTGLLMSKSNGTGVFLDSSPKDLYGAIMAQPDGILRPVLVGITRISLDKIEEYMNMENPRDAKMILAKEIVKIFHSEEESEKAEESFKTQFQKGAIPEDIEEFEIKAGEGILNILKEIDFVSSNSEARRKVEEGAVKIDDVVIEDPKMIIESGEIIKLGRKIAKLNIK